MEKTFRPKQIEQRWYQHWEEKGYFTPRQDSSDDNDSYCIMIPPPNVTGSLHMGHAFQHTIMDALVRYQRMQGRETLWQVGTDHAGIATQMVVERKLTSEQGKNRHDLGRDAFVEKIWQWKEQSGDHITQQMRRLGNSVDWNNERFTMDDGFYAAVQTVFVSLYNDGLIYRGKRLVNWDPKLHTAISDLEVENKEINGSMWHLRYPLANNIRTAAGEDHLVVATTRPETLLGDSGVAVNPDDPRYRDLIGQYVMLPLVGRKIPIVGDPHADMEKGTGCVKITPAHDFNDSEVGKRHRLAMINVLDKNGAILSCAEIFDSEGKSSDCFDSALPEQYAGLDRFAARKLIVAELEQQGLLDTIKDHSLSVPYGDRSGVIVEPLLTDQWYVDAKTLAKPAIEAVESGRVKFVPQQYENMYFSWMRDIQDWCISRQLWWGHRIPAWYDDEGQVYVGENEAAVRAQHKLDKKTALTQDEDVLDTWFSSALWTFATLGWPEENARLTRFHPTNVLVTGFDIIFFWVARMMMLTLHFMKDSDGKPQPPFETVYVTGLIRDEQGQKMSKSKGNVIDPLDMIDGISLDRLLEKRTGNMMQPHLSEKIANRTKKQFPEGISAHGADALRFTLAALASTGRDINWDMNRLEGYRNFCNKLWNAARYVLINVEGQDCGKESQNNIQLSLADRWIISRLQQVSGEIQRHFDDYRLDLASQSLYDFIWNEYCDWYLELSKPLLWEGQASAAQKKGTRHTLVQVLENILRLAHPIIPFITEEIWQSIRQYTPITGEKDDSIMLQRYPQPDESNIDSQALSDINWARSLIIAVRNIRGEMNIPPGKFLPLFIGNSDSNDRQRFEKVALFVNTLAKIESIDWLDHNQTAPTAATQLVGELEIMVPLEGLIDKDAEIDRLGKEIDKLKKETARLSGKLSNSNFIDKAPAEVVSKEKQKLVESETALERLDNQRQKLQAS